MRDVQKDACREKESVAPVVALRFTAHKQESVQVGEPPWFQNLWRGQHEVQNRGNQWPHKIDLGPTKYLKTKLQ